MWLVVCRHTRIRHSLYKNVFVQNVPCFLLMKIAACVERWLLLKVMFLTNSVVYRSCVLLKWYVSPRTVRTQSGDTICRVSCVSLRPSLSRTLLSACLMPARTQARSTLARTSWSWNWRHSSLIQFTTLKSSSSSTRRAWVTWRIGSGRNSSGSFDVFVFLLFLLVNELSATQHRLTSMHAVRHEVMF